MVRISSRAVTPGMTAEDSGPPEISELSGLSLKARIQRLWREGFISSEIAEQVGLPEADVERIRIGERDREIGVRTVVRKRMPRLSLPLIHVIERPADACPIPAHHASQKDRADG